jgi:hypothetical protein
MSLSQVQFNRSYPKLRALRDGFISASKIHFSGDEAKRKYLITTLEMRRREIEVDKKPGEIESFIDVETQRDMPQELLDYANTLHKILGDYWSCHCAGSPRSVNLHLATLRTSNIVDGCLSFDLLFSQWNPSDNLCRWQEGDVVVRVPKYLTPARCYSQHSLTMIP